MKQIKFIVGLGSGRCGTLSLAKLLSLQPSVQATHEAFICPWNPDYLLLQIRLEKLFDHDFSDVRKQNFPSIKGSIISDTSSWYLAYVDYIVRMGVDAKFICIERDYEQIVKSWYRKVNHTWHWMPITCIYWEQQWFKNNPFRSCFPKYNLSKYDSVMRYVLNYYEKARLLQNKYPDKFRIFQIDDLNTEGGVSSILHFAGIKKMNKVIGIKLN